jgi:hypothetical protein
MFLIDEQGKKAVSLARKTFSELNFSERKDLQEWICGNTEILGEPLLIIQKEFDGFFDTNERLDLLALDKDGNLVVIENKLDDSGKDVVWQALKYVSYCALLKKSEICGIFAKYVGSVETADENLSEFFDGEAVENIKLNESDQRIILVAANFRKEVTTTVLWLCEHGVDVKCVKVTPYQDGDRIYLDAEQILPMQGVEDYQVRLSSKKQEDATASRAEAAIKKLRREFWAKAISVVGENVPIYKHCSPSDNHWLNGSSGVGGIKFNLLALKDKVQTEIYIDVGDKEKNKAIFAALIAKKAEYESALGLALDWRELPAKRASRILYTCDDGFLLSDSETWDGAIERLSKTMKKIYDVFKKPIETASETI